MNNIRYSPRALQDMDDIWDYIALELKNPTAAQRTVDRIMDDVARLKNGAFLGAPLSSIVSLDNDFRYVVSGNYMAFYRVDGNQIEIARVLYGRRKYLELLFSEFTEESEN